MSWHICINIQYLLFSLLHYFTDEKKEAQRGWTTSLRTSASDETDLGCRSWEAKGYCFPKSTCQDASRKAHQIESHSQKAGALLWRSFLPAYVMKLSETHLTFTSSARPVLTVSPAVPSHCTFPTSHLKSQAPVNVYLEFFF